MYIRFVIECGLRHSSFIFHQAPKPTMQQDRSYHPQNQGWNNYSYPQYPHYRLHPYGGGRLPNPYNTIAIPNAYAAYTSPNTQERRDAPYWADAPPLRRYPHLNPVLAVNETVIHYDVRKKPKSSIPPLHREPLVHSSPTNELGIATLSLPVWP